jgi:hypothetical protein
MSENTDPRSLRERPGALEVGRRHASAPASTRYRRTVITMVVVAVIAWLGWAMFAAWSMRDWTF